MKFLSKKNCCMRILKPKQASAEGFTAITYGYALDELPLLFKELRQHGPRSKIVLVIVERKVEIWKHESQMIEQ
jgi:hypothetical protein